MSARSDNIRFPDDFTWGVASSAYQVEGGWKADGKGLSVWDEYTNRYEITRPLTGQVQTGNVAINQYSRKQYLTDIEIMKKMGVDSYRFSIAWTRLLPDGIGAVNQKGIDYYSRLIDDLIEAGIEPIVTLFHWDLPLALAEKGGWDNQESVDWFAAYAALVFEQYGDRVNRFITFNEPYIDLFLIEPLAQQIAKGQKPVFPVSEDWFLKQLRSSFHWMMAHGKAVASYRKSNFKGEIGITLSISPAYPETKKEWNKQAARIADGLHNRWFLDPVLKGRFPKDMLLLFSEKTELNFDPDALTLLKDYPVDFIGVNYYSSYRYKANLKGIFGVEALPNTDKHPSFNGPVYPEGLFDLLVRIDREYHHPAIYITENGSGFGPEDDRLKNGKVDDVLRTEYLESHLAAAGRAIENGVDLKGYYAWSVFDNFEWLFGYTRRFGLVYVDFETQQRIWKKSALTYRKIIKNNAVKLK